MVVDCQGQQGLFIYMFISIFCSFQRVLFSISCTAFSVIDSGRVLILSYFSYLMLPGSIKSAWSLENQHSRLMCAVNWTDRVSYERQSDLSQTEGDLQLLCWTWHEWKGGWALKRAWKNIWTWLLPTAINHLQLLMLVNWRIGVRENKTLEMRRINLR